MTGNSSLPEGNYTLEVWETHNCKDDEQKHKAKTKNIYLWLASGEKNMMDFHSHCKQADNRWVTAKSQKLWVDETNGNAELSANYSIKIGK